MRRRARTVYACVVVLVAGLAACGSGRHHATARCPVIDRVDLGDTYAGLAVERSQQCEAPAAPKLGLAPAPATGVHTRLAVYGTCTPPPDGGCAPPVQVQVWRACERNFAMLTSHVAFRRTTIRGVPAAVFDGGRVELYTGADTVVVFAHTTERALAAAEELRGTISGAARGPRAALPPPVAGAMAGGLTC